VCKKTDKKFPTVWENMSENRRGDFFDSHCRIVGLQARKHLDNMLERFKTMPEGDGQTDRQSNRRKNAMTRSGSHIYAR